MRQVNVRMTEAMAKEIAWEQVGDIKIKGMDVIYRLKIILCRALLYSK